MKQSPELIPITELVLPEIAEIDLYQKRERIYTRHIKGFYQRLRLFTGWPILVAYTLLPWLSWGDKPFILFDLPARQFHILSLTFWPQDFPMLAWLLIIAAFALFAITNFLGRVWCGYTCPQTVWTSLFMWSEQMTEGKRNQRIKLDKGPWNVNKVIRKTAKHSLWIGISVITGVTFIGFFSPIEDLVINLFTGQASSWEYAWSIFFTCATYINAGWMREQICTIVCPYAKFQSVMFDQNTLIISYDKKRGEGRGSRRRDASKEDHGLGDCIDCKLCVQVCPTGIDIRDGLQLECIGCALCVDACNQVMEKMDYPKHLISYTTENAMAGKETHFLRPRLIGYAVAILVMVSLFSYNLINRIPLRLDVERERSTLYHETSLGMVQNTYNITVMNMGQTSKNYTITVSGIEGLEYLGEGKITVAPGEVFDLPARLQADPTLLKSPSSEINFTVTSASDSKVVQTQESRFIGPFRP